MKMYLATFHGWGLNSGYWSPLLDQLTNDIQVVSFDAGYFRSPHTPAELPKGSASVTVITHSFGLFQVSERWIERADRLIIISGFTSFLPVEKHARRMTQRVLRKMELNLYKSPKDVLNKFYSRMREPGDPTEISLTVQDEPDSERLASDLKRMANEVIDTRLLCKVPEIILVSGGLDRVVPKSQLQSIEESIVDVVQHIHIPDAGHNIPQTHTSKCLPLVLNQ